MMFAQWFKPIILENWEAEVGGIIIQGQLEQKKKSSQDPISTNSWVQCCTLFTPAT
jgi:hypothetical protein